MLAAAILSAGESRRMGQPKALLPYRGITFLEHLIEVTRHPRVGMQIVVLGAGADEIQAHLALPAAQIVINPDWRRGQLSSIQSAIRSLPPNETEGIIITPVDHPLISVHLIDELIQAFTGTRKAIVVPTHGGRRGHPVIFRASLYEQLLGASDSVGARQVVRAHPDEVEEVVTDEEGVLLNLNDPEALRKALGEL
ncbi:MAG TPA: nucleotidyltransferase family protein [Candidatus Acidoferrum sp.]|nr:nucleotidyltransferase family protein [Candidatus Acidoferrum sp.]